MMMMRARFLAIFRQKESQVLVHFLQKKSSVFNPLNSGGLFYKHWYNNYGIVHFVFKAVDSLWIDVFLYLKIVNFLIRADNCEMPLFGYSLFTKVPVCKYSEWKGLKFTDVDIWVILALVLIIVLCT